MRALAKYVGQTMNRNRSTIFQMLRIAPAMEVPGKHPPVPPSVAWYSSAGCQPHPDFLCSNRAKKFVESLKANTHEFNDESGSTEMLESELTASIADTKKKYDKAMLKSLYLKLVRPELLSRALIHSHPLNHPFTSWLAHQTHGHLKKKPRFISSYDLMVRLIGLLKEHWVFFLNYLGDERIAVVEEWNSISTVQNHIYDHGLKDFGSGIHFYKGECDAAYFHDKSKANLSSIIWDNDQVLSSITYQDVSSYSIQQAEAKAAFALLNKAKELKLEHLVLWTDSKTVCGILSGTRPVDLEGTDGELFMALKSMRTSFDILVPIQMPREVMVFSDGMLRKTSLKYPRFKKKSAQEWAYYLNGLPAFRLSLTQEAQKILNAGTILQLF